MIDDDFPPMAGQAAAPRQSAAPGPGLQPREAFPDLAAAAAVSGSDQEAPSQQRHRRCVASCDHAFPHFNIMFASLGTC